VISVLAVSTNRCAQAFAQGLRGGIFTAAMPGLAQGRAGGFGELPGAVADQEPEACGAVAEAHQEIADLLYSPRPVRIRGHARGCARSGSRPRSQTSRTGAAGSPNTPRRSRRLALPRPGRAETAARSCRCAAAVPAASSVL
jgi:hypothetical protein